MEVSQMNKLFLSKSILAATAVLALTIPAVFGGCGGSKPGATAPAKIADFPGEDTRDSGRPKRAIVEIDQREEEGGD
jgi:hypothetical protein